MYKRSAYGSIVFAAALCAAGCNVFPPSRVPFVETAPADTRWRLGYLEHRERVYPVARLLDPDVRAASDDPFVQGFVPDSALAAPWAGMEPRHSVLEQAMDSRPRGD